MSLSKTLEDPSVGCKGVNPKVRCKGQIKQWNWNISNNTGNRVREEPVEGEEGC
uniref:Uncharacterized protein n=1 Tax=Timema monikensis TaxID=170555 RepID=A0A7R9EHG8_9NEOP|nr:unnamed protein product [Timema monikensis]